MVGEMTRTSHRWQHKPGSFDTLHTAYLFLSANDYGIPDLLYTPASHIPAWLVPYRQRIRANDPLDDGAVHFFMDDYRFETVWQRPFKALEALSPYQMVLTPDFSLYRIGHCCCNYGMYTAIVGAAVFGRRKASL